MSINTVPNTEAIVVPITVLVTVPITEHETRILVKYIVNCDKARVKLFSGGNGGDIWGVVDYENDEACHILFRMVFETFPKPSFIKHHYDITVKQIDGQQSNTRMITIPCDDNVYVRYCLTFTPNSSVQFKTSDAITDDNITDDIDDEYDSDEYEKQHRIDKDKTIDTNYQFAVSNMILLCDDDIYRENGWTESQIEAMHAPAISAYLLRQYVPLNASNGYFTSEEIDKCVWVKYEREVPDNLFQLYWSPNQTFARNSANSCEPIEIKVIKAIEHTFLKKGFTLPEVDAYDKSDEVKCQYIEIFKQRRNASDFKWSLMLNLVYDCGIRIKAEISQPNRARDLVYPPTEEEEKDEEMVDLQSL